MENTEKKRSTPIVYTLGYGNGWSVEALEKLARHLNAIVIDTRFNPMSRIATWRKGPLTKVLGELYQHQQGLGNENYKTDGPIKLHAPEMAADGLMPLVRAGKSLILICVCKDQPSCHRTVAAAFLAEKFNLDIVHLRSAAVELADDIAF